MVEPNYLRRPAEYIPNDQRFGDQWGLRNTGQPHPRDIPGDGGLGNTWGGYLGERGVGNPAGSPETIIAVLDDGVDIEHPDLATNLWTNPASFGRGSAVGFASHAKLCGRRGRCRYLVVTLEVATPPLVLRTVMCSGFTAH
jgi:hypothetical protein